MIEAPTCTLSVVQRVPNSTLVHVSCTLSKIPYGGFSPVRLQTEAPFGQPYPSRSPHGFKPQVDMHPWDHRFDKVFVFVLPSCLYGGYYQRLPQTSQDSWLYHGSLPYDLVWAAPETFPAL